MFKDILIYLYLILLHEFGHFLTAKIFGWETDKIYIYPYGGCTKFNADINTSIKEEFLVLISGPIFQIIATFILLLFIDKTKDINMVKNYSFSLLVFNLLPIYPLDGGRLLNLFFNKVFSFRSSFVLSILSSIFLVFVVIVISIRLHLGLNFIMMFFFLLTKIMEEFRKRKYYYNKFVLERYIHHYYFNKYKSVGDIKEMMRERGHIFKKNGKYITEKQFLKKIYKN